jgi:hypothetical protein
VELLMAVEKSKARVVGDEVDFVNPVSPSITTPLTKYTGRRGSGRIGELEGVAVKMNGMDVVASVAHAEAVTFALL